MNNLIKVNYYIKNELKDSRDLSWPQKYEDIIEDITKNLTWIIKIKKQT